MKTGRVKLKPFNIYFVMENSTIFGIINIIKSFLETKNDRASKQLYLEKLYLLSETHRPPRGK
jgi:hypothetical protein